MNPDWWLERPHPLDKTPDEDIPTFTQEALFVEYLKREYDDIMPYDEYKAIREKVIRIVEE